MNVSDSHFKTSALKGKYPGQINIEITKGDDNLNYFDLTIVRKEGSIAPDSCSAYTGNYAMSISLDELKSSPAVFSFSDFVKPGAKYSYLVCISTAASFVTRSVSDVESTPGSSVSCSHKVVVTKPSYDNYNLKGLAGADAECNANGSNYESTGKWKAILSSSSTSAKDRITASGPICNSEGKIIAADTKHFFSRPLTNSISFTPITISRTDYYGYTYSYKQQQQIVLYSGSDGNRNTKFPDNEWTGSIVRGQDSISYTEAALGSEGGSVSSGMASRFPDFHNGYAPWYDPSQNFSILCISNQ